MSSPRNDPQTIGNMDPYQPPQELSTETLTPAEIAKSAAQKTRPITLTWKIVWHKFFLLFAVFFVIWGPINVLISYLEYFYIDPDDIRTSFRLEQQASLWLGVISTGAAVTIIAATYDGAESRFGNAMLNGLRLWPKLWTAFLVYALVTGVGILVLLVPGIYFAVRGFYAVTISAADGVYGIAAINRSFALTRGRFWETFLQLLVVMLAYVVAMILLALIYLPVVVYFEGFEVYAELLGIAPDPTEGEYSDWDDADWASWEAESDSLYPQWYWIVDGLLVSLTLLANLFAAVYVYCCYREVDDETFNSHRALHAPLDPLKIDHLANLSSDPSAGGPTKSDPTKRDRGDEFQW